MFDLRGSKYQELHWRVSDAQGCFGHPTAVHCNAQWACVIPQLRYPLPLPVLSRIFCCGGARSACEPSLTVLAGCISAEKQAKPPVPWGRISHWWFFHSLWKINRCALAGKWLRYFWGLPAVSFHSPRFLCHLCSFVGETSQKKSEQSLTVVFTCTFEVIFLQQSSLDQNTFRLGGDTVKKLLKS